MELKDHIYGNLSSPKLSGAEVKARMIFRNSSHCSLKIWASTFFKTCLVEIKDENRTQAIVYLICNYTLLIQLESQWEIKSAFH